MAKKRRGQPKKRFCIHGHDTFIKGRSINGTCVQCNIDFRHSEKQKEWRRAYDALYHKTDKFKKYQKKIRKEHPEFHRLRNLRQQTKRKLRIPEWGQEGILEIYKNCPQNMEVDHIIPLQNKLVSGLHVEWNLQYLTRIENITKKNQFDGTLENNSWKKI